MNYVIDIDLGGNMTAGMLAAGYRWPQVVRPLVLPDVVGRAESLLECASQLIVDHGEHVSAVLVQEMMAAMADLRSALHNEGDPASLESNRRLVALMEVVQGWYGQGVQEVRRNGWHGYQEEADDQEWLAWAS
ncbi:MAG: hypothetical protein HQM06_08740 [Magnetococcales bacterium]|nr:hypothetical protein [Magnetococcales bacterium]